MIGAKEMKTRQIYIGNHILLQSAYSTPELHAHTALHILMGEGGSHICCTVGREKVEGQCIVIESDVLHTAQPEAGSMLVFLLDPTSYLADKVRTLYLKNRAYAVLDGDILQELAKVDFDSDIEMLDQTVLMVLGLEDEGVAGIDERIRTCIEYMNGIPEIPDGLFEELLRISCLSKSRFSHLFKQETGIAYSHYLVMLKMRKFYENYLAGNDITVSAINAGFDSPSHLAAVCKKQFGLSFSDFSKTL